MTSVLTIEGKEYVPATIAGKHFGYTKDYLLLLIKQGSIDGKKIGNRWYVHIPSAEKFFVEAREKREVRKKEISQERKAELKKHTQVRKQSKKTNRLPAMILQALVVFVIALSIGTTGYVGVSHQQAIVHNGAYGFFEDAARSVYAFIFRNSVTTVTEVTAPQAITDATEHLAVSAHIATTTYTSLVVAPDELFTATTVESIQDSFSDPVTVTVDSKNPQTGIITPVFKKGAGEAYRFLMVPVTQATTTQ